MKKLFRNISILFLVFILGLSFYVISKSNQSIASTNSVSSLKVHGINVHQGSSTLIQTPDNRTMLIDAGKNEESSTVVNYLKKQGVTKIDVLVGTHPDEDHIGGIDVVINNFKIGQLLMPNVSKNTKTYKDVLEAAASKQLKITNPIAGSYIKFSNKIQARILAPNRTYYDDANDYSIVTKISYGKTSFIITGDAEKTSELEMIKKGYDLKSTVLFVGHHGSKSSTSAQFLIATKPQIAIISVGPNSYGHPAQITIDKLNKIGAKIYRTDLIGDIVLQSDGNTVTVNKKVIATSSNTQSSTVQSKTNKSTTVKKNVAPQSNTSNKTTVYTTASGTKYHSAGCKFLKKSCISIRLSDAKAKGLKPCSVCNPPK